MLIASKKISNPASTVPPCYCPEKLAIRFSETFPPFKVCDSRVDLVHFHNLQNIQVLNPNRVRIRVVHF